MGESTTITHAILTIVAVLMASLFAAVVIGQINTVLNVISTSIKTKSDSYRLSVTIIHASLDKQANTLYLYAKNTGDVVYSDLENIDFIVTDYAGKTFYFSTRNGIVQVVEYGTQDRVFEKGETVLFQITLPEYYTPPLEVKMVLSSGYSTVYTVG
uniref:Flagellin n=1 Tax=Thermosphaera aggregans TaxID=54254 RepID=A0A7C2BLG6_9CREN